MSLEELEKRIDENLEKIMANIDKIEHNSIKINDNKENIQKNSYALEILKDYKKQNKRLFIVLIIMAILWTITLLIFHL